MLLFNRMSVCAPQAGPHVRNPGVQDVCGGGNRYGGYPIGGAATVVTDLGREADVEDVHRMSPPRCSSKLEQLPLKYSDLRPLRPADTPAWLYQTEGYRALNQGARSAAADDACAYQSEGWPGRAYGALETALERAVGFEEPQEIASVDHAAAVGVGR